MRVVRTGRGTALAENGFNPVGGGGGGGYSDIFIMHTY